MAQLIFDHPPAHSYSKTIDQRCYREYGQQLQSLARVMTDVILTCDLYHPWIIRHISDDFVGTHDLAPGPLSISAYINYIRYLKVLHPGTRILVAEEWMIDFDDSQGELHAVVCQFARVKLDSEGILRGRLGMSHWRLERNDIWVCYRYGVWRCDSLSLGHIAPRYEADGYGIFGQLSNQVRSASSGEHGDHSTDSTSVFGEGG